MRSLIITMIAIVLITTVSLCVEDTKYDEFAKCLTENGATMYGSYTCPHCQNQKDMFGSSFKYISYVDCNQNSATCAGLGISYIPAWIINENKYVGEQSLQQLSDLTGCELPV